MTGNFEVPTCVYPLTGMRFDPAGLTYQHLFRLTL
jgi:hypothetical protein